MITMTVTASCLRCDWSATGPSGDWDAIRRLADKHLAPGHPVTVTATPSDVPAPRGAAQKGTT